MYRFKIHQSLTLVLSTLIAGHWVHAFPSYERTHLPPPSTFSEYEREQFQEVLQLEVYKDSVDPNQYYFIPPFHIRQYDRGAASMMLHSEKIKHYAEAIRNVKIRNDYAKEYTAKEMAKLEQLAEKKELAWQEAKKQLFEILPSGNAEMISLSREYVDFCKEAHGKAIKNLEEAQKKVAAGETLLPAGIEHIYNEPVFLALSQAGFSIGFKAGFPIKEMNATINETIRDLEGSYGGFLSVNAYAGFTKRQLDHLRTYLSKYHPKLKVSLLPMEKLSFFSLSEHQKDGGSTTMFRQINGSGDYLGAALVMDTTLTGALGMAEHMAPFILPVGIKGMFLREAPETTATLDCQFQSGFRFQGRADVRDGLVIFDNDIVNAIHGNDVSGGRGCKLEHTGDLGVAEHFGLLALSQELERLQIQRTVLATEEKQRYWEGIMQDIQANRRPSYSPRYSGWWQYLNPLKLTDLIVEGARHAADFHWHTNAQNMSNTSNLSFTKEIHIKGHTQFEKDLPTNLCLVYNPRNKAYDRCTPQQAEKALTMRRSIDDIAESVECREVMDPFECGRRRDAAGIFDTENYTFEKDDILMNSL